MTRLSPCSNVIQPQVDLRTLPKHFSFFSFLYVFLQSLPTQHSRTLPAASRPAILQNNLSRPLPLLRISFFFSLHRFLYLSRLPAATRARLKYLTTLSYSSHTQQRTTSSPTSCHLPTHVPWTSLLIPGLVKQSFSILLITFVY